MPGITARRHTKTRPTKPGETRFWCGTCDPDREHPFYSSTELVKHVMQARARRAGHEESAVLSAGLPS